VFISNNLSYWLYLFKRVFRTGSSYIKIDWFVLQNKEDIADFVIFTGGSKLEERSSSRLVPYNLRSQTIKAAFIKVKNNFWHNG